jgi:hypothetical protein
VRKVLLLAMAIALVATMLGLGATAMTIDTEQGHTILQACEQDLMISPGPCPPFDWHNNEPAVIDLTADCLKPGDTEGVVSSFWLKNVGEYCGYINLVKVEFESDENGCNEPEQEAGDDPSSDVGELQKVLAVRITYAPWQENILVYEGLVKDLAAACPQIFNGPLPPNIDLDLVVEAFWWPGDDDKWDTKVETDKVTVKMYFQLSSSQMAGTL